jgi:biotin transporter BioY
MHIAAVGWMYVVLMMAITEDSVVAGIMTFFLYGVLPTLIIVYIAGSGQRKKRREMETLQAMQERQQTERNDTPGTPGAT